MFLGRCGDLGEFVLGFILAFFSFTAWPWTAAFVLLDLIRQGSR